jgi:hypothetical protein
MADVIIRFSVYSKTEESLQLLENILKPPHETTLLDSPIILTNGSDSGRKHQTTAFDYRYELKGITDIEVCNEKWLSEWSKDVDVLLKLYTEHGFFLDLNYEVTLFNNEFPSFYFQSDFTSFIGKIGIKFSLYFYVD